MNPVIHLTNDLLTYSRLVGNARHLKATKTHGPAATAERFYVKHARMEIAFCVLAKISPYEQFRGASFLYGKSNKIRVHEMLAEGNASHSMIFADMLESDGRAVFIRQLDPANYEFFGWTNNRIARRFGATVHKEFGPINIVTPGVLYPIQTLVESLRPQS